MKFFNLENIFIMSKIFLWIKFEIILEKLIESFVLIVKSKMNEFFLI